MTVFCPLFGPQKGSLQIRQLAKIVRSTRGDFGSQYNANVEGFRSAKAAATWQKHVLLSKFGETHVQRAATDG
jgi:hypothetical protein